MILTEQAILKQLSIADIERANAYAKDLSQGLQILRTFPQGVTIFGSARLTPDHPYCQKARELGGLLAQNGHAVVTGGGPGIMEAASQGSYEFGGRAIGLNIKLDHEQFPNPYLTDCVTFEYFFARKVMLAMASKVFVMFPGGLGTMDELSEIIELMKEGKMPKMPTFLIGKRFWKPLDKMYQKMYNEGLIDKTDGRLCRITDDIHEVVAAANKVGHPKISENFYDGFREASALVAKSKATTKSKTASGSKPKAKS